LVSLFCLYKLTEEKTGNQGITPEHAVVTSEMGKRVPAQKFTHVMLTSCFHEKGYLEKGKTRVRTGHGKPGKSWNLSICVQAWWVMESRGNYNVWGT